MTTILKVYNTFDVASTATTNNSPTSEQSLPVALTIISNSGSNPRDTGSIKNQFSDITELDTLLPSGKKEIQLQKTERISESEKRTAKIGYVILAVIVTVAVAVLGFSTFGILWAVEIAAICILISLLGGAAYFARLEAS